MVSETSAEKVSGNGDPEKKGQIIANVPKIRYVMKIFFT